MQHGPRADPASYPSLIRGIYVVGILMLASALAFMDRSVLSLLVGQLHRDLALSDSQIGLLQGLAFAVFFTTLGLPIGWLADRIHRPAIIAGGILVWSIMTMLSGFTHSFHGLLLTRIGVGAGEACLMPAALSLIGDYFPPHRRGRAIGFFIASSAAGVGVALLVGGMLLRSFHGRQVVTLPIVGTAADWQAAFILLGAPGIGLGLIIVATLREVPRRELFAEAGGGYRGTWPASLSLTRYMRADPAPFAYIYGLYCLTTFVTYAVTPWAATVFIRRFATTSADAGLWLGPMGAIAGVLGCLLGGLLGDRWTSRAARGGKLRSAIVWSIAIAPAILMLLFAHSRTVFAAGYAIFAFVGYLVYGSGPAILQEIVPGQLRGRATALWYLAGGIIGIGISPVIVPLVEERFFGSTSALMPAIAAITLPAVPIVLVLALRSFSLLDRARQRLADTGIALVVAPRS